MSLLSVGGKTGAVSAVSENVVSVVAGITGGTHTGEVLRRRSHQLATAMVEDAAGRRTAAVVAEGAGSVVVRSR